MSAPVINPTTSVLSWIQWAERAYQPYASNSPTGWTATGLPPGFTIDASSGRIIGAGTVAGDYNVALVASNADGASTPFVIFIGIDPAEPARTNSGLWLKFDADTRQVTVPEKACFKGRDQTLLYLQIVQGDATLDLDVNKLTLAFKELIGDPPIAVSTSWHKFGTGTGAYYAIYIDLTPAEVLAALSNYETDDDDRFQAKAEIELIENYSADGWTDAPTTLRSTSDTFVLPIVADFVQAEAA